MPRRPLKPATMSAATIAMWDLLADGQWHPNDEILAAGQKACMTHEPDRARAKGLKVRAKAIANGRAVTDEDILSSGARDIAGNNLMVSVRSNRIERDGTQHRMLTETVHEWLAVRGDALTPEPAPKTTRAKTTRAPRVFGGIVEDEVWASAPLRTFDLVHFRSDRDIPVREIQAGIGAMGRVKQDTDGLYRIECRDGRGVCEVLEAWCEMTGHGTIGLRVDTDMKRRELSDLPAAYLDDLCKFYVNYSLRRLQRNMSSIRLHIPDNDDIRQQVYLWILDAVMRFDDTKGVPFGAYLSTVLTRWVHDLNRNSFGRTAADAELRQQRAMAKFETEHQRMPTEAELAAVLGQDLKTLRRNQQNVAVLNSLRACQTLDGGVDDYEIPVVADDDPTADIMSEEHQTLISAALTMSCKPEDGDTGPCADEPNILGWVGWYMTTWAGSTKTELSEELSTSMRNLNVYSDRVAEKMQDTLRASDLISA